jgi:hypothetical protein
MISDSTIFFVGLVIFLIVITAIILTLTLTYKVANQESLENKIAENKNK